MARCFVAFKQHVKACSEHPLKFYRVVASAWLAAASSANSIGSAVSMVLVSGTSFFPPEKEEKKSTE